MKRTKLVWNIFIEDSNSREIESFNVFEHYGFLHDVKKANTQFSNNEEFLHEVDHALRYYFWAKCEYETLIQSLFDGNSVNPWKNKVDGYWQINLNKTAFQEYLLNHRKDF